MKDSSFPDGPAGPGQVPVSAALAQATPIAKLSQGFAKVVAGGRIVRLRNDKPFLERMVTGVKSSHSNQSTSGNHAKAVLESITSNLEAGIDMVDHQSCLAKWRKALRNSPSAQSSKTLSPATKTGRTKFVLNPAMIRELSQSTYDNTALFSKGSPPITSRSYAWRMGRHLRRSGKHRPARPHDRGSRQVYGQPWLHLGYGL